MNREEKNMQRIDELNRQWLLEERKKIPKPEAAPQKPAQKSSEQRYG